MSFLSVVAWEMQHSMEACKHQHTHHEFSHTNTHICIVGENCLQTNVNTHVLTSQIHLEHAVKTCETLMPARGTAYTHCRCTHARAHSLPRSGKLTVRTHTHTHTEWETDPVRQLSRITAELFPMQPSRPAACFIWFVCPEIKKDFPHRTNEPCSRIVKTFI